MKMVLLDFLCALFLTASQVYAWYKISNEKYEVLHLKNIFLIILLTLFSMLNFKNINPFIKTSTMIFAALFFCKILLNKPLKDTIIIIAINYLLLIVSEALFGLILVIFSHSELKHLFESYSGSLMANIVIGILMFLISRIKYVHKLYLFLVKNTLNLKNYHTLIFLFTLIICSILGFTLTYYTNSKLITFIFNIIITIIYALIIVRIIKTKNMYMSINKKYNNSLDSLTAQEMIIKDYRILNHENKNQLLAIRSLSKNKKVHKYIDTLLKRKDELQNNIIETTIQLPEGGMKGLITQKLILMKNKNINYNLNIDKKLSSKDFSRISDEDNVDLCQILGVLLDNSIEATEHLEHKEISIIIYKHSKKLNFEIINSYDNTIKFQNNSKQLMTSKERGHGYGLQLVRKIIRNNPNLSNTREITKESFKQVISVKIK